MTVVAALVAGLSTLAPAEDAAQRAKDAIVVRTLLRLRGDSLENRPEAKAALLRHLETLRGSQQYLEIVERFKLRECADELLRLALAEGEKTLGVDAAHLLVKLGAEQTLAAAIADPDPAKAAQFIATLGLAADAGVNQWLQPLVENFERPLAVRAAAVAALGRNAPGQRWLLDLVTAGKLPADLQFAAANALLASPDEAVRAAAAKHLALPAAAGGEPLPPIAELVGRTGDAARGRTLFAGTATCAKCHKVAGEGKDVGPDLSEIGSKLSKEAMYLAILDPSAGVSFNYETWVVRMLDGTVHSGILQSQTDEAVELKTAESIVHRLRRAEIEELRKSPVSLMPADLQKQLRAQDLVDLVEYLATLRRPM